MKNYKYSVLNIKIVKNDNILTDYLKMEIVIGVPTCTPYACTPLHSLKKFMLNFACKICYFLYNLIYYEYKYGVNTYY